MGSQMVAAGVFNWRRHAWGWWWWRWRRDGDWAFVGKDTYLNGPIPGCAVVWRLSDLICRMAELVATRERDGFGRDMAKVG